MEAHEKATQRWIMGIFDENNLDYYRFGLDISNTGAYFISSQSANGGAWLFVFVHRGMVANTIVKTIFRLDRCILPAT
jgi:hypothetical protein